MPMLIGIYRVQILQEHAQASYNIYHLNLHQTKNSTLLLYVESICRKQNKCGQIMRLDLAW